MTAERMRRHRSRMAAGRVILRVEVDEVELAEVLIENRFLRPNYSARRELEAATEKMLAWAHRPVGDE